jgi:alanyl-tRNA synthetase
MKTTINKQAETLKKRIDNVSKNSKDNIKSLIESNTKQFDAALETNKKTFNSISKMLYEKELDPSIVSAFKSSLGKEVKLSEEVIDSIIDSHTKGIDLNIDFTSRFMDILNNEDLQSEEGINKLVELVKENFSKTSELSMNYLEKIVSVYNQQLNLTLNFNKNFADTMNSQIASMFKLQKKSIDTFFATNMITEWWKNLGK